jgi:large subunit ribosomal protein L23
MAIFGKNKKVEDKKKEEKKAPVSSLAKKETMKDLYGGVKSDKGSVAKTKDTKDIKDAKDKKIKYNSAYKHLIKPLITEKAANLATEGKYVFEVSKDSNKIEVAKSIEEIYGLRPIHVNILNIEGKRKKQGKTVGKRKDWKKAIITLRKGQTIDIYEGV